MNNKIILNCNNKTRDSLNQNKFSLCVFLAIQSPNQGSPLCWNVVNSFLNSLQISWDDLYVSYISTSEIKQGSTIFIAQPQDSTANRSLVSSSTLKIMLKQQMVIDTNNAISIQNNSANSIGIKNNTVQPFTSGIGVSDGSNKYFGISSFTLFGNNSLSINPVNKVFLMMAPQGTIQKNMVVTTTNQQGILIDLNGADNNLRTVEYNINNAWNLNDETWCSIHESGSDLSQILISNN
jgi:hypothetical protein